MQEKTEKVWFQLFRWYGTVSYLAQFSLDM